MPRSGDRLYLTPTGYPSKNDIEGLELEFFKLGSGFQGQNNGSKPIVFRAGSEGFRNEGFLFFDIHVLIEGTNMPLYSSSVLVPRNNWKSFDGNPCGVVKTGTGKAGIGGGSDFAGFKYVEVREGRWCYGVNGQGGSKKLEAGQVFTFAAANTYMCVGTQCAFTNFWLRETGAAVGGNHYIGTQYDNNTWYRGKLTIAGTPPEDETVFTGSFIETVDFPEAPTVNWSFGANSSLRVKGSIKRHATNWCYFGNNGTLYLDGPLKMDGGSAFGIAADKTVYFNALSNDFGGVWFWFQGNNGRIFTTVPYAVTTDAPFRNHNGYNGIVWDMCGCDQGVKNIGFSGNFTVTVTRSSCGSGSGSGTGSPPPPCFLT